MNILRRLVAATLLGLPALAGAEPPVFQKSFTLGGWSRRAALSTFWSEPWFFGFYWWQWCTRPPQEPGTDTEYTPQSKPAESVLREFYGQAAPRESQ